jgi:hypothetical protein
MPAKVPPVKPGQSTTDSGIYESSKSHKRTTLDKGEKAPPTPLKGEKWNAKVITNPKKKK